jgi:hypothetical protein
MNGMKILLISDPETDKAAAAMDVHIGEQRTGTIWYRVSAKQIVALESHTWDSSEQNE